MTQVMKLWHSIGNIIRSQMEQRKGVKLDHFGSFSFDILGEPCFNVSADFKRTYKVHQTEIPSHDNSPVSKLNLTQLSRMTGLDRSASDKTYNKFVTTVGAGIRMSKNVLITVHKVAEIFINNDSVKVMFLPDFLSAVGSKSQLKAKGSGLKARPSSAPRARRGDDVLDVTATGHSHHLSARARPSTPSGRARPSSAAAHAHTTGGGERGSKHKKPVRGKKLVESSMSKTHNPILGDEGDIHNAPGRKRAVVSAFNAGRNPILNQEEDEEYSQSEPGDQSYQEEPYYQDNVSIYSSSSRGSRSHAAQGVQRQGQRQVQRPGSRGGSGSGLVKENLSRHNAKLAAQRPGRQPGEGGNCHLGMYLCDGN